LQTALAEAYETGVLRGKALALVRKVLKQRERSKQLRGSGAQGPGPTDRNWTPAGLLKVYEREATERRVIIKKADMVQSLLAFTVEAFKQLLGDEDVVELLKTEGLTAMPRPLAQLLGR
jgi:ParB family chromosome partitioning protein